MTLTRGDLAPDFELTDQEGRAWKLSELKGQKVILYFYPADDTPGCTKEACDFRDTQQEWRDKGFTVLGVSPQGLRSKQAFADKYDLNFPLLADEDRSVEQAYGAVLPQQVDFGDIPLTTSRSTFVIDEEGRIEDAMYGVSSRGHVASLREKFDL